MELSGFEPLASWVRWKSGHLRGSGQNHSEGAWLRCFRALSGTSRSRRLGSVSSRLDADWTRPQTWAAEYGEWWWRGWAASKGHSNWRKLRPSASEQRPETAESSGRDRHPGRRRGCLRSGLGDRCCERSCRSPISWIGTFRHGRPNVEGDRLVAEMNCHHSHRVSSGWISARRGARGSEQLGDRPGGLFDVESGVDQAVEQKSVERRRKENGRRFDVQRWVDLVVGTVRS